MRVIDSERLRLARKRKKFSQAGLASAARCSQTTIWKLEKGDLITISDNLGEIIAHFLDRDVEELFEREAAVSDLDVTSGPRPEVKRRSRKPVTRRRPPATELKAS